MKALITGASSGIGMEIAKILAKHKCELILVARSKEKLEELQKKLPTKSTIIVMDLSNEQKVKELYIVTRNQNIDIVINNAGFGLCGDYEKIPISKELELIDTNIRALHILTKSFLRDMIERDSGYILNVSSSASFLPGGPLMTTYYASKSYVSSLTNGIYYELKKRKSNVSISLLCPGPVNTNFNKVAMGEFSIKEASPKYVAEYAIDKMFKKKMIIVPTLRIKLGIFLLRLIPYRLQLIYCYHIQGKKLGIKKK